MFQQSRSFQARSGHSMRQGQARTSKTDPRRMLAVLAAATVGALGGSVGWTGTAAAANIEKANNTTNLEDGGSWVGGTGGGSIGVPTGADIAVWDNVVTGANTSTQAADLSFGGILVTNPG